MRLRASLLGITVAVLATTARADEGPEQWDAELRAQVAASYDAARPHAPSGPLAHTAALAPQLSGAYFLRPLQDQEQLPLGLLEFYEHPGRLQIALDQRTELSRMDSRWRTARRALGITASGTGYPWEDTGLRALFGADYSGLSAESHNAMALSYEAGLIHYFRPNLRGEIAYVGSVGQSSRVVSNTTAPALEDLESASNAGRLAAEAILMQDRLGLRVQLDVGQFTEDRTSNALVGTALPGEFTDGLLFAGLASATGYFNRELSVSLEGGLRGRSANTQPDSGTSGAISRTSLTPLVSPAVSYFFRDDLFATLQYALAFPRVDATGAPSSRGLDQTLSGAVALRL